MFAQCFLCGTISSPCCYPPLVGNTEQGMAMMVKGSTKTDKGRYGWKPGHAKANKGYLWARKREMWRTNKTYLIFPAYGHMPNVAPNKPGSFFLLIQTLPTFCVRWILILRIVLGGKGWVPKSGRTISKPFRCPKRPAPWPCARPAQGPRPAQGSAQGPAEGPTHARTKARPDLGTPKNTQKENSQNYK